jgi:hypothetical protein
MKLLPDHYTLPNRVRRIATRYYLNGMRSADFAKALEEAASLVGGRKADRIMGFRYSHPIAVNPKKRGDR